MKRTIKITCMVIVTCMVSSMLISLPVYAADGSNEQSVPTQATQGTENSPQSSGVTTPSVIAPAPTTPSAITTPPAITTPSAKTTPQSIQVTFKYCSKIPMKKEHQKLLWDYCKKRNLGYIDMLALIFLESNFREKAVNHRYKGYFQINSSTFKRLAKTLKTANKPLDGAININLGTRIFSNILQNDLLENLKGDKKRDAALAIFQMGAEGYKKHGLNTRYLGIFYKKLAIVSSYFK